MTTQEDKRAYMSGADAYIKKDSGPMAISSNSKLEYLDYVPVPLLIINRDMYIVFYNQAFADNTDFSFENDLNEVRTGDALNCLYSHFGPDGCGSSRFCSYCGVYETIIESIKDDSRATHEAQHIQNIEGKIKAVDYLIQATPFIYDAEKHYIVTLTDISIDKWNSIMENLIFHNILESVKNSFGLLNLIHEKASTELRTNLQLLKKVQLYIANEIEFYKIVREAETGNYQTCIKPIQISLVVKHVVNELKQHLFSSGKRIKIGTLAEEVYISTDKRLLHWVLSSILKNALEATPDKGSVKISCRDVDDGVVFEIHNEQVLDMNVQLQLFKRSFSTKGKHRGIGAYAAKMITENYLGGKVEFSSQNNSGTVFMISLRTRA